MLNLLKSLKLTNIKEGDIMHEAPAGVGLGKGHVCSFNQFLLSPAVVNAVKLVFFSTE